MTNEHNTHAHCSLVVLISGSGSNLQAIIDATRNGRIPARIAAVISNQAEAYGLQRAQQAGIETRVLDNKNHPTREAYDHELQQLVDGFKPDLVILAGFMRILTPGFVEHYQGRMLNIHPSLLPRHRGLHTHRSALEAGDTEHGASVHFVTAELDSGPVVLQVAVPVNATDTENGLAARVLEQEHRIYPMVIDWFVRGRLKVEQDKIMLDNKTLAGPCRFDTKTGKALCP